MIKVKNSDIQNSIASINAILARKLGPKTAFKIAKTVKVVGEAVDTYNKTRENLIDKHARKDENGQRSVKKGENGQPDQWDLEDQTAFEKDINELLDIEIELDINKIKLEELGEDPITPQMLVSITWLIEE